MNECDTGYVRREDVERKVELMYRTQWLEGAEVETIRNAVDAENAKLVTSQKQRRPRLLEEEKKNGKAFRADAMSIDVLKAERERIDKERADTRRVIKKSSIRRELGFKYVRSRTRVVREEGLEPSRP